MKRVVIMWLTVLFSVVPAQASQFNLDPYFSVGSTAMNVDLAGTKSTAPSLYFAFGTKLNWISPYIAAEFRFGYGGQYNTFDGNVNLFTSYLLKPSFEIVESLDAYALLGATTMSVKVGNTNFSDTGASYGAGLLYHVPDESMAITAEWMNYHKSTDQNPASISGMDITGLSLAVVFEYY